MIFIMLSSMPAEGICSTEAIGRGAMFPRELVIAVVDESSWVGVLGVGRVFCQQFARIRGSATRGLVWRSALLFSLP